MVIGRLRVVRTMTKRNSRPTAIASRREHEECLSALERLASKENPTPDEEKYARVLVTLVEAYEEEHGPIPDASPVDVLRALMEANNLQQKDLAPIFGSESIVSEVLHKKRELNKNHIDKLSKRFHVSPTVFFRAQDQLRVTSTNSHT